MTLRVALAGQEAAGAHILRALADSEHDVVAVLTQEPTLQGGPASLAGLAERLGVRTLPAKLVRDPGFARQIQEWSVDILLNAHSLHIIADDVLAAPAVGSFNLHPGPLPEYAGLYTVGWAIYNGESEYGVTVHWMAPLIDAGPIAFQERFPVAADATALSLSVECTRRGVALLVKVLECADDDPGSIPVEMQDASARTYYPRQRIPQEGRIDWTQTSEEIDRFARAFDYGPFASPWGRPVMEVGSERIDVAGLTPTGEVASRPAGTPRLTERGLEVACSDEWIAVGRLSCDGLAMDPKVLFERFERGTGSHGVLT